MSQKRHKKRKEHLKLEGQRELPVHSDPPAGAVPELRPELRGGEDYGSAPPPPAPAGAHSNEHAEKMIRKMQEATPEVHVMIGVPTGGNPKWEFCHDLCNLVGYSTLKLVATGQMDLALSWVNGCYVACNRNDLVVMAMKRGATHILFLDDDMRFPPWALEYLLARREQIIGANYTTRKVPIRPITMVDMDWGKGDQPSKCVWSPPGSTGIDQVEAIGGGVTLIDLAVFNKLKYPYFEQWWDESRGRNVGEDVDFCKKALDAGIPVHIDHDLSHHVRHIGDIEHRMDRAFEVYQVINMPGGTDGAGHLHEPEDSDSGLVEQE